LFGKLGKHFSTMTGPGLATIAKNSHEARDKAIRSLINIAGGIYIEGWR
jgi:hypothetical protein